MWRWCWMRPLYFTMGQFRLFPTLDSFMVSPSPINLLPILWHYCNVIIGAVASQITSLTIVYSTVYSDADQRKHQSSASLAFVRGIHRGPVNSPHKWPVTRKMFPFDDVIMKYALHDASYHHWNGTTLIVLNLDKLFLKSLIQSFFDESLHKSRY